MGNWDGMHGEDEFLGFFSSITRQVTKIFPRISKELVAFMFCRCIKVIKLQMMQNDFACLPSFPLCNTSFPQLSGYAIASVQSKHGHPPLTVANVGHNRRFSGTLTGENAPTDAPF